MNDWFEALATDCELSADADRQLRELGFVVIPGPAPTEELAPLAEAYDNAVASAAPGAVSIGRTTTRVHHLVNHGPAFDALYVFPPILAACCRVIGQAFKLSVLAARTLRAYSPPQDLHVDFERDARGFPMVGFILMLDAFRPDNGATRFIPGSHTWSVVPDDLINDPVSNYEGQRLACGPAGSIIVYNGSVWHGHTANITGEPRRSIQGAYIRRDAQSGVNLPGSMIPETLARISPIAKYLLAV
jgi:hypothetical protein